jgi:hypothetical protein
VYSGFRTPRCLAKSIASDSRSFVRRPRYPLSSESFGYRICARRWKQLRALEAKVRANPQASDARFVLAYHYLTLGSKAAAAKELKKIYAERPEDRLVKELLLMTGGAEAVGVEPAAARPAASEGPAVPAADLIGKWTATGEGKATFVMDLTKEGNFSWTYTRGSKSQEVKGVYAVDGNVLAMEPESGG